MMQTDVDVTVRGPVRAGELGVTLPHEHVLLNLMLEYKREGVINHQFLAYPGTGISSWGRLPHDLRRN